MKYFNYLFIFLLSTSVFAQETILGLWEFTGGSTDATTMNIAGAASTSLGFTKNGDQASAPDGSVNVAGRAGFSGNFLTGMAITPADLTGGKLHLSVSFNSLDLSPGADGSVAKYQLYIKGTGGTGNNHRFIGFVLEGLADESAIKVSITVYNNGEQFGVSKRVGKLGTSLVYNNPITIGTTMDFTNNKSDIWVGSPGENATSPWGFTSADATEDGNQSTTWAAGTQTAAPNAILKQMQFNIVSKTGVVNVDQIKISTGDYENTLSNDFVEVSKLNVYPNPAGDIINVFGDNGFDTVEIFNISGQKVHTDDSKNSTINVKHLTSGMYLIKSGNAYFKFIKK